MDDLLILDETDWHLFDDICQRDAEIPKCKGIIGVTATSMSMCEGVETAYLNHHNFKMVDSGI